MLQISTQLATSRPSFRLTIGLPVEAVIQLRVCTDGTGPPEAEAWICKGHSFPSMWILQEVEVGVEAPPPRPAKERFLNNYCLVHPKRNLGASNPTPFK